MERRKAVPGFEGLYSATYTGGIFSHRRNKLMKPQIHPKTAYAYVRLSKAGRSHNYKVHRLVALAYHSNPKGLPEVNHKDGVKANNAPDNLEWCTHSENMRHADRTGLRKLPRGEGNHQSKLTWTEVRQIRALYARGGWTHRSLAARFGVCYRTIGNIVRREAWHDNRETVLQHT